MNEDTQKDFEARVKELAEFANSKQVGIFAAQQITKEGYIETVPMFRNLKPVEPHSVPEGTTLPEEPKE